MTGLVLKSVRPEFERDLETQRFAWLTGVVNASIPPSELLARLPLQRRQRYVLQSSGGRPEFLLGLDIDRRWSLTRGTATLLDEDGSVAATAQADAGLSLLRAFVSEVVVDPPAGFPSCVGGVFGYLGQDACADSHARLAEAQGLPVPDGAFEHPRTFIRWRQDLGVLELAALERLGEGATPQQAWNRANERLARLAELIGAPRAQEPHSPPLPAAAQPRATLSEAEYLKLYERAKAKVVAGEVQQLGVSLRLTVPFTRAPAELFEQLCRDDPSPLVFALGLGEFTLVGASPRLLAQVRDGEVTLRPIGGTHRRSPGTELDDTIAALQGDRKEIGEHLMLLGCWLEDLKAIAAPGTIRVTQLLEPEVFSRVVHLGSTLHARLAHGIDPIGVLRTVLPAPTVVGVPKALAQSLLHELEPERRSVYGGSIGYFGRRDAQHFVSIRTAIVKDQCLHVQAGAGIIAASHADSEYREIMAKASALLSAATQPSPRPTNARTDHE